MHKISYILKRTKSTYTKSHCVCARSSSQNALILCVKMYIREIWPTTTNYIRNCTNYLACTISNWLIIISLTFWPMRRIFRMHCTENYTCTICPGSTMLIPNSAQIIFMFLLRCIIYFTDHGLTELVLYLERNAQIDRAPKV